MPNRAPTQCNHPACPQHAEDGSSYCEAHQKSRLEASRERDRARYKNTPWRKLYDQKAWWGHLQPFILARDPICKICNREGAYIADHIRDHKGDLTLFFDPNNLRGVCKRCHDARRTAGSNPQTETNAPVATGTPGAQFVSEANPQRLAAAMDNFFSDDLGTVKVPR